MYCHIFVKTSLTQIYTHKNFINIENYDALKTFEMEKLAELVFISQIYLQNLFITDGEKYLSFIGGINGFTIRRHLN